MYETDVLVIGSGNGGLTAAIEAPDRGADVIMLDKGPLWGAADLRERIGATGV